MRGWAWVAVIGSVMFIQAAPATAEKQDVNRPVLGVVSQLCVKAYANKNGPPPIGSGPEP